MENIYNISDNVKAVNEQIHNACAMYNRDINSVTLMAVSKTQSIDKLQQAFNSGITLFGENRVQELVEKSEFFSINNVPCHIIGQLQTNKVKYLPKLTNTIQSVDSIKLAQEINKQYSKHNIVANVLLEVNIGQEESKAGFDKLQVLEAVYEISQFDNVKINGLMCIPPVCANDKVRYFF